VRLTFSSLVTAAFFFSDRAPPETYTLSLHDALPISEKLGENERRFLDMVLEASPSAREAYSLLQEFRRILTERRAAALRSWLEQAARSSLAPLRGFARSLEQDMDAVMNALTYPWSNGRVQGYINKLKLLKRQMYGRAGIDLLKRRFLAMGR